MKKKLFYKKEVLGTGLLITLLCCVTPLLVIIVGFAGLSWLTGYLDYGLTPLLGFLLVALTLLLYHDYKNKKLLYLGFAVLATFIILYLVWSFILGVLVIVGALLAVISYFSIFKKACIECGVKP